LVPLVPCLVAATSVLLGGCNSPARHAADPSVTFSVVPVAGVSATHPTASRTAQASAEQEAGDQYRTGYEDLPQFGGESSVAGQLEADDQVVETAFRFDGVQRALEPYFAFKQRMQEEHGLAFGTDYTGLYHAVSDSPGEDDAASGIFRVFGTWTVVGRGEKDTGSIVFKGESRHRLGTDAAPSELGFEAGYVGLPGAPYNDEDWWLTNLFWQQRLGGGRFTLLAGLVDATDYLDIYGLINPWSHFTNLVFLTGSGTMPAPNQGLGFAAGAMLSDQFYVVGGLADSNGDPGSPGDSFESFFDDSEFFKHVELGWTSSQERIYLDNVHVTFWHADERDDAGVPDGWGLNFSAARYADGWLPFLRAGHSDDGGALLENSVSAGIGRYRQANGDLVAVGLNWGEPSEDFGSDLDDQYTAELFYRLQLSQNFALTPSLQFVVDPATNPDEDAIYFLGLRGRLAL
jgi:porin